MSITQTKPQAGTWTIDPTHTHVGFVARHLVATKVRGSFESFAGTIDVAEDLTESTVSVEIDAASISTGAEDRDNHLRSGDFFDADAFPTLTFASKAIESLGGDRYRMIGDLTIKDVTRSVALDVEYLGMNVDPWGNDKIALEASTRIDREEWGLTWNAALETGGVLVSKEIAIEIEVQASKA